LQQAQQMQIAAPQNLIIPDDPVVFARDFFGFNAKDYQAEFLRDQGKRIVLRWSRQVGKTTCIALRAIWFALTNQKTLTIIVAPTLRQSMIVSDRIQDFLFSLPKDKEKSLVDRVQRTTIRFKNGSRVIALPNNPQMLRGYTANEIICDESAFFKEDELVFFSVLYPMLSTTDGTLIASSTPWGKKSVFYRFCQSPDFKKYVVTWEDGIRNGLGTQKGIEETKSLIPLERFQCEYMAEFIEDVDTWLTQSLIVNCIDGNLVLYDFQAHPFGEFYVGVDFGKERDFSVVIVFEKQGPILRVIHVHRFPLHTEYASVIGYVKSLQDRWITIRAVYCDITGVGNYIAEDMAHSGILNVIGITFTVRSKEEMATILREKMRNGEVKIPYIPTKRLEDVDLTAELNVEKYQLMKTGHIQFSHTVDNHDDVFWACALSCYAAAQSPMVLSGPGVAVIRKKEKVNDDD